MAFLDKSSIPQKNWRDAKSRGYSFLSDTELLLDGMYVLNLRTHIINEARENGIPGTWYDLLNIEKTDNAGSFKKTGPEFQWPSAPWVTPRVNGGDKTSVTFFLIKFKSPEDLTTFRLTYL